MPTNTSAGLKKREAPDVALFRIASRQHGSVTIAQLMAAGLTYSAVTQRIAAGRLQGVMTMVYERARSSQREREHLYAWPGQPRTRGRPPD